MSAKAVMWGLCLGWRVADGGYFCGFYSDNTIRLWDTESSDCVTELEGHASRIWDLDSTNKGEFVASGSGDGTVKVHLVVFAWPFWNTGTKTNLSRFAAFSCGILGTAR